MLYVGVGILLAENSVILLLTLATKLGGLISSCVVRAWSGFYQGVQAIIGMQHSVVSSCVRRNGL